MFLFERLEMGKVPWEELDKFEDRTLMQTLPWLDFVSKTQSAEPMVAVIKEGGSTARGRPRSLLLG